MTNQFVRFAEGDSRTGDHSYSGWHSWYQLCDGTDHYKVVRSHGAFSGTRVEQICSCDRSCTCAGSKLVALLDLPSRVQELLADLPARKLA